MILSKHVDVSWLPKTPEIIHPTLSIWYKTLWKLVKTDEVNEILLAYTCFPCILIAVAPEQYTSLLTGLHAVGQVKGWKVQQLVFVGGTCGSVHVESFNKNMKALGSLKVSGTLFVRS